MKKIINEKLPAEWAISKLSDIAHINMGQSPSSDTYNLEGVGLPFFQGKAEFGDIYPKVQKFCSSPLKTAEKDDILISVRAPIGPTNLAPQKCCIGRGLASIKTFGNISHRYLLYYLRLIEKEIVELGTGTTFKAVSKSNIENIDIIIPPLEEQNAIVARVEELFSELDNASLKLNELIIKLNIHKQSFFKSIFSEGIAFKKQEFTPLKDISTIVGGVTKGRDLINRETVDLPYLRVANVQDGYLDLSEVKTITVLPSDKEKYRLEHGDILYTEGGDRDKLGRGTVWKGEIKDCIHQNHVFRARLSTPNFDAKYISYYSQSKNAKDYFYINGKQTTNLASINITILSNLLIPVCPIEDQVKIVEKIDYYISIYNYAKCRMQEAIQDITILKHGVLTKAYTGQLLSPINTSSIEELFKVIEMEKNEQLQNSKKREKPLQRVARKASQGQTIMQVLTNAVTPLSAKAVWEKSIYKGNIELFYGELKKLQHLVIEERKGFLSLKKQNQDEN